MPEDDSEPAALARATKTVLTKVVTPSAGPAGPAGPAAAPAPRRTYMDKLTIGSLDDPDLTVRAQYNPKDVQLDRSIPWGQNNGRDNRPTHLRSSEEPDAEYTGAPPRTMTIELLFDRYEVEPQDWSETRSVEPLIEMLDEMACVREPGMPDDELRRPHHCVVTWGAGSAAQGMRAFRCVIESLSTKYLMFDRDGTPVRAQCTIKLREASVIKAAAKK